MGDLPSIPNWLAWLLTIVQSLALAVAVCRGVWRQFLADWWARRSNTAALRRIAKVAAEYREHRNALQRPERVAGFLALQVFTFVAITTIILLWTIITAALALGAESKDSRYVLIWLTFISPVLVFLLHRVVTQRIAPFLSFELYESRVVARLTKLLKATGFDGAELQPAVDKLLGREEPEAVAPPNDAGP